MGTILQAAIKAGNVESNRFHSIFGIAVGRRLTLQWLFPQEKATFHGLQKVRVYSENALCAGVTRNAKRG
jgi:hypothetical protein